VGATRVPSGAGITWCGARAPNAAGIER
jgi:hypothetical protein